CIEEWRSIARIGTRAGTACTPESARAISGEASRRIGLVRRAGPPGGKLGSGAVFRSIEGGSGAGVRSCERVGPANTEAARKGGRAWWIGRMVVLRRKESGFRGPRTLPRARPEGQRGPPG